MRIAMPVALVLVTFISLLIFQASSTRRTQQQVFNTLQDTAETQARAFDLCLDGRFETLQAYMGALDPAQLGTTEKQLRSMGSVILATDFSRLMLVDDMGEAFTSQGLHCNIKQEPFFAEAMAGREAITKNEGDSLDPAAHFVLAIPARSNGRITGVVAGTYSEHVFRDILNSETFDGAGYSVLCNRDGDVVIISDEHVSFPQNNVFSALERSLFVNGSLADCKNGFATGTPGIIGISRDGVTHYAVYMPVGVNDWMLLNFVPDKIVETSVSRSMQSGLLLTGVIMCIAFAFIIYIFFFNRRQQARIEDDRRRLMLSDERFRVALAETSVGIWEYDFQSRTVYCSEDADKHTGFPSVLPDVPNTLIAQGYIHPDSAEAFLAMYEALFNGEVRAEGVFRVCNPANPTWRYEHIRYKSLLDQSGKPYRAIGMSEDVTEKQQAKLAYERELQVQQAMGPDILITALFDATDGRTIRKWFRDERESVALYDDRLETFTNYIAQRIVNTDGKPQDWQPTISLEILQQRYASGQTEMVFEYLRSMPDGTERYVEDESHLIIDPDSGHLMMFSCLRDVDNVRRQKEALLIAVESDSMTGLLNHEAALERIRTVLGEHPDGTMHALFMIDIDDFKVVNDTFGHQVGDDIIKQLASLVRGAFRDSDVVGRIGGDEFIALMRNVGSVLAVRRKAQELIDALKCSCRSGEHVVPLSVSVGVCTCETAAQTVDMLYREADAALYESKASGKSRYTLHSGGDILIGEPQSIGGVASSVHLRTLLDNMEGGVIMAEVGESIHIVYASPRLYGMMAGESPSGATDDSLLSHIIAEDRPLLEAAVFEAAQTGKQLDDTYRVHSADGAIAWRHIAGSRLPAQSDGIARIIGIVTDITEKKRTELTLAAAKRQFSTPLQTALIRLADVAYEFIALIDTRSTLLTLLGTSALAPTDFVPEDGALFEVYRERIVETFVSASERDDAYISFSLDIIISALSTLPVYTRIYATDEAIGAVCRKKWQFTYLDETRRTIMLTRSDVTDTFLAEVDPVTGVFNRYKLAESIRQTLSEHPNERFVLIRADIDNFKVFNDIYGVEAGDRLLKSAADYLRDLYYRFPMLLYGHIEADHFLCLVPVDMLDAMPTVPELVAWLSGNNPEFAYSPRIGVYRIDDPTINVALMSDCAYLALRSIKGKYGRHVAYYSESMRRQLLGEQEIVSEMHRALTGEQFDIYLQPQYDYASGEITGAEALARWLHPEKGMIMPSTFIPVFEQNGFITRLDEYIWERVCMLLAKWRDAGEPLVPISVNVSRVDIYDHGILTSLENLMQKYALSPSLLRLEITESAYMENPRQLINVAEKLRAMGFAVEMDDFGSGYSSLNMLSDVQVDTLKLDMHFLSERGFGSRGNNILHCIVRMMRWLHLPLIAEGVETVEQAEYMKSIGCSRMQGYLFGKPMPVEAFERLKENAQLAPIQQIVRMDTEREALYRKASADAARLFAEAPAGALIIECCEENIEALRVNDRFFETSGLTRQAFAPWAASVQDMLPKGSRQFVLEALQQAISTGTETRCTIAYTLPNGGGARRLACTACLMLRHETGSVLFVSVERI